VNVRRLAVATMVALGLLAPAASATGTKALDGTRTTHARYTGTLTQPAYRVVVDPARVRTDPSPADPNRADCTKESCDVTALRLTVPRGSSTGRFVVSVKAVRELSVGIFLYDATGEQVAQADVDRFDSFYLPPCCGAAPDEGYTRGFVVPRLDAGKYTLVIYNRAGYGEYTADVTFTAHPADRPKKK
jgi:hypothetical protein